MNPGVIILSAFQKYQIVQFSLLIVVRVPFVFTAELAEITVHIDAILAVGADQSFRVVEA
jgi:hypothetical protein